MTRTRFPMFRTVAAVVLSGVLAACGGTDPAPSAARGDAAPARPDLPWTLVESQLSDTALAVTRGDCTSERFAAEVSWTLQPTHGPHPQIWLASADREPKLWVAPSQREGTKETGTWLYGSSVIYLVDGAKDLVIARVKLSDVTCGA